MAQECHNVPYVRETFAEQSIAPEDRKKRHEPCEKCGSKSFNSKSTISLRTYNPHKKKMTKNQEKLDARKIQRLSW